MRFAAGASRHPIFQSLPSSPQSLPIALISQQLPLCVEKVIYYGCKIPVCCNEIALLDLTGLRILCAG